MSEADYQETNGTSSSNGDVPEIELIIKEEYCCADETYKDNGGECIYENKQILEEDSIESTEMIYQSILKEKRDSLNDDDDDDDDDDANVSYEGDKMLNKIKIEETEIQTNFSEASNHSVDYASVVAETCEDLLEQIENDLKMNVVTVCHTTTTLSEEICKKSKNEKRKLDYDEIMQEAIKAVLKDGLSLGEAAKMYNVSKSTLWTRVSKHPNHRRRKDFTVLNKQIHTKLLEGLTLSEISRSLKIAKSTVHMHKERLIEQGVYPKLTSIDNKPIKQYLLHERLQHAYHGYCVNGMSIRFAADFFAVPLTSLWRFIKRNELCHSNIQDKNVEEVDIPDEIEDKYPTVSATPVDGNDNAENISPTEIVNIKSETDSVMLFQQTILDELFE